MPNILIGSELSIRSLYFPDPTAIPYRQTVFYTPTTMTVSEGQKINGRITCAPNTKNNRDLDIAISYQTGQDPDTTIQYKMCVIPFFPSSPPRLICFRSVALSFLPWEYE